jgi:hypothetical protein
MLAGGEHAERLWSSGPANQAGDDDWLHDLFAREICGRLSIAVASQSSLSECLPPGSPLCRPGRVFVSCGLELLLEDREQFENAGEVVLASRFRYHDTSLVAAIACSGDVKDEAHAISFSASAWPVDCCAQARTPVRAEVTDLPPGRQGFHWVFP